MPRQKVSEEVKDMSEANRILDDENRARITDQLTDLGIADASALSDVDLLSKLSQILAEEHKKRIELEASQAIKPLNVYAAQAHEDLKDKDFIERLYNLSIPSIFLPAFRDEDAKLKDEKLWEIVKHSGIYQFENPRDAFKNKMVNKRPYYRDIPKEFRGR